MLELFPEFVSEGEERGITSQITFENKGHRTTKRYGSRHPYPNHIVEIAIPESVEKISYRLVEQGIFQSLPRSVSINQYISGQVIYPHIDNRESGETIAIVSLKSGATMRFTKQGAESLEVTLLPRSLLVMEGELRWDWKHEILPVTSERWSIVFRC